MIQGKPRRFVLAVLIACAVAFVLVAAKSAEAQIVPSMCSGLTPSDWDYWARQCWMYPADVTPQLIFVRVL